MSSNHDDTNNHDDLCRNEINLSIQYILNCGMNVAGSCHGGSASGVYEYIKHQSGYVPYDTCMSYIACSDDSTNGFCPHIKNDTKCIPINICRTCDGTGTCTAITTFPNATIAEYGTYSYYTNGFGNVIHQIKSEIYLRGPVAAAINANPLLQYKGGIINDTSILHMLVNHVVSIVGWGYDNTTQTSYWIVRNSWGMYWGEMSYFRIIMGYNALGIESDVVWATPGSFTIHNIPCRTTRTTNNNDNCQSINQNHNDIGNDAIVLNDESSNYIDPSQFDSKTLALKLQRQRM
jgi:cathepsin X